MKNYLKIISALAGLLLVLTACNKNENDLMPEHTANDPTTEKILAFKAKLGQADKIDETMSIDSAVWYIEAALNYTHCVSPENTEILPETSYDTVSLEIGHVSSLNFLQVVDAYNYFDKEMQGILDSYQNCSMYIKLTDVFYSENKLKYKALIKHNKEVSKVYPVYTINGDWMWGMLLGDCFGNYSGKKDATTEITKYLISVTPDLQTQQPGIYYTSLHTKYYYHNGPEGLNGLLYIYLLPPTEPFPCLSEEEVRYWANLSSQVYAITKPLAEDHFYYINPNLEPVSVRYGSHLFEYSGEDYCTHRIEHIYGIPNETGSQTE